MARRAGAEHERNLDLGLERAHKEPGQGRRARLRILIASDPNRPVRAVSLPHALPAVVSLTAAALLLGTIVLACWSWKMRAALAVLEHRVRAMVQAADGVALRPDLGEPGVPAPKAGGRGTAVEGPRPGVRGPSGAMGRFVVQSANTGEEITVAVDLSTGEVEAGAYRRLRRFMRCLRTGAETPVDPRLIELLYRIAERTHQKIVLVSGFRAPMFSIASLSYHTRGMAADIRIPGMTPLMVRDLAESMNVGGIGYYPVSGFVHVDVRDDRSRWTDFGENRQDTERAEHGFERGAGGGGEITRGSGEAAAVNGVQMGETP
jgi:uncharacterized protein YcbK (DUF882 family)